MDSGQPTPSRGLFIPKTERLEEDEALTLHVHLPGFSEKQIHCRIIAPSHYIRVCSNPAFKNWHFDTLFEDIPEKFNLDEAKTQFNDGTLTIRVPKIVPAQASTSALEAPSLQESSASKLEPQKSGNGAARQQTWPANVDKEITEAKDVEGRKSTIEQMSQNGQVDDRSTIGQVDDQKEESGESVDQEKEGEAKDMEKASSSGKTENHKVTTVETERRYVVDKCTILSLILAIGAYVFYTYYGQSRKKSR